IMDVGYRPIAGSSQQPASFFPLLPWTTRAVHFVIRSELGAAIFVTTVASFAAVVLVYEVLRRWKGESVARWAIVFLLAFPTYFFLCEFYTHALFIWLKVCSLVAMIRAAVSRFRGRRSTPRCGRTSTGPVRGWGAGPDRRPLRSVRCATLWRRTCSSSFSSCPFGVPGRGARAS